MRRRLPGIVAISFLLWPLVGCQTSGDTEAEYSNPFLDGPEDGKEDTGYVSLRGKELHVTLEADVEASSWRIFDAPAELAQFAVTYLRNTRKAYLEILAEDVTAKERVEWLVDGQWLTYDQVEDVPRDQLRHFRIREVNLVVQYQDAEEVQEGDVLKAVVPIRPFKVMEEAGDSCAEYNSHIPASQSVYWYLWDPERSGCRLETQEMSITVEEVLPTVTETYPEYDRLWEDGRLDVVVLWGQLDDGDPAEDQNWKNVERLAKWLEEAGFEEVPEAPLGRRFQRVVDDKTEVVDIYGPTIFESVADYMHLENWQKAVREHEVVIYNGHSVLGSGMAFERADYPDFYQIFVVASCLSYEYYVRPILAGKGGWENVDVVANVTPTYYYENLPLTGGLLARLFEGFEHGGRVSWQDILETLRRKVGHYRWGVSGARTNCFTPSGNKCDGSEPEEGVRFANETVVSIPDNDPDGVVSTIEVDRDLTIGSLRLELDITHTWVGDLVVTISHDGRDQVVWSREGGSDDDIRQTFEIRGFEGSNARGTWTLTVVDRAARDTGTLNSWAIVVTQ